MIPSLASAPRYDVKIDSYEDLAFVGVAKRERAELITVVDGKITSISITKSVKGT